MDAKLAFHIFNTTCARDLLRCCRDNLLLSLNRHGGDCLATNRITLLMNDEPIDFANPDSFLDLQRATPPPPQSFGAFWGSEWASLR